MSARGRLILPLLAVAWLALGCAVDTRRVLTNDTAATNDRDGGGGREVSSPDASSAGDVESPSGEGAVAGNAASAECSLGSCPPTALDAGAGGPACAGCFVSGVCFAVAASNPDNPCEVCDPQRDAAAWSLNDGAVCDDGLFCTVDDVCQAGSCRGAERTCEDGVACNGVSICLELEGTCSAGENQCADIQLCNVELDACVSTCEGCVVDGVCIATGAAAANNPCLVCDPAQSTTSLSATEGAPCGNAAAECSGQDTCNALGQCAPNHLAAGTSCGPLGPQCDAADTCDGSGLCVRRLAQDGSPCDDGQFCTDGDRCQGGQCLAGGARNCGANQSCDEAANQCRCTGCSVNGNCFASGALNPTNACQICNPNQNAAAFVGNVGATCGSAPGVCSGQDTCNAQGGCAPNHSPSGTPCGNPASGPCNAPDSCNGSGQCSTGEAAFGTPCEDGQFCTDGDRCQGGQCTPGGGRDCGDGAECNEAANACVPTLGGLGDSCSGDDDCGGGLPCNFSFIDSDGDGFGSGEPIGVCGTGNPNVPLNPGQTFRTTGGDCCDAGQNANLVFPGQERYLNVATACGGFDYNCDGEDTLMPPLGCTQPASVRCEDRLSLLFAPLNPGTPCGDPTSTAAYFPCTTVDGVCTPIAGVPEQLSAHCR